MNALLVFVVMITLGCQSLSRTSEVTGSPENHEDYIEIQSIPTASENQDFAKFLSKEISEARILGLGEVEERVVVLGSRDEKSLVALDEVALEVVVGDLVSHRAEEQRPGDSDEPGEGCGQQFLPVLG